MFFKHALGDAVSFFVFNPFYQFTHTIVSCTMAAEE